MTCGIVMDLDNNVYALGALDYFITTESLLLHGANEERYLITINHVIRYI